MNALSTVEAASMVSFDEIERMAAYMSRAKLFGSQTPEQLMSLMLIAQANGQHPAAAARDYDVIQGRPSKKAEAMLRDFLIAGGSVEWHAYTDAKCDATFSHPQGGSVRVDWDLSRVKKAKISNEAMYSKYPRNMFRARCISEGVRTVFPVATGGMHTPEEARGMPVDMGPATVIVPDVLLAAADAAAEKGAAAYQDFWQTTGKDNRKLLAGDHAALKQRAADADAARTIDNDPPTFGDVTEPQE